MAGIGSPGARTGATGAGCLPATTAGTPSIARPEALRHHCGAFALRSARLRRLGPAPGPDALVAALAWGREWLTLFPIRARSWGGSCSGWHPIAQ